MNLPAIGDLINQRYRLDAILGAGGFGTVFLATDLQSRGTVAVKVLHPDDGATYLPATQRRFEREVAILTQLENEHTVRLLSYGSTPSRLFYLVFEHLAGRDLVEVLQAGPLPAPVAEHILRQLLASLAEAHRAGLTHRDIKPANVRVLERDGDAFFVKLLDFGISRSTDQDRMSVTKTGEMIGTPRYMSPEQLRERELTPASDVYSLGMVAVEMLLGGAALLPGGLGAQLERLQSGYLLPVVPNSRLQHVIQRMTASRPQDRYRTAALALRALDGVVEERAPVRPQRRGLGPAIAVIAALGLLAGLLLLVSEPPPPLVTPPPSTRPLNTLIATPDLGPSQTRDVAARDVGAASQPDLPACYSLDFRGMGTLVSGSYEPAVAYHPPDVQGGGLPLVVFLHGKYDLPGSDEMDSYLRASGLIELADEKRFAIVAPRDRWLAAEPWEESEDVEQLKHWVDYMSARGCIDTSRVYVVTQSDSSFLSYHLRCADWVTAIASNGSRTVRRETSECGKQALPSMWVTPRDTDRMPKDGGTRCRGVGGDLQRIVSARRGSSLSLVEFRDMLKIQHKCRGEPRAVYRQGRYGTCLEWACGTPLRICTHSGGEPWPGTTTIDACAGEASEFAVGEQMWSFFETVPPLKPK